jgi:carboxymethylenebutenolidase
MTDITIAADDEGRFGAYLAEPAGEGNAPGMIVIQEILGVDAYIRGICDDYAAQGYIAVAPDLFWRQEPGVQIDPRAEGGMDKAMALYGGFSETKGVQDLIATLAWLRKHPCLNGKVGAVGYCLGGKLAYFMATRSDIDAAVGYYGVAIEESLNEASAITRPLILHVGGQDRYCPEESQKKLREGLAPIVHATVYTYAGADHGFAHKGIAQYDAHAAALADHRTAALFLENLGAGA